MKGSTVTGAAETVIARGKIIVRGPSGSETGEREGSSTRGPMGDPHVEILR